MLSAETPTIVAKHNRRTGLITSITFIPGNRNSKAVDKQPLRKSVHMGQAYSFREGIWDTGRKAWSHAGLLTPRDQDAELFLASVFRAVPLSCMAQIIEMPKRAEAHKPEPPSTPATAKVIAFRPRVQMAAQQPALRLAA
jgi:hypothetical protein